MSNLSYIPRNHRSWLAFFPLLITLFFVLTVYLVYTVSSVYADTTQVVVDEEVVFIDNNGIIRVLDLSLPGATAEFLWSSPVGNWAKIALGTLDPNRPKQQIIATNHSIYDVNTGRFLSQLIVYDPVIDASDPDNPTIRADTLYTQLIPGQVTILATGNFDVNVPGDEILYGYQLHEDDKLEGRHVTRFVILRGVSPVEGGVPDGSLWQAFVIRDFSINWSRISVGNIDHSGKDEIALVSHDSNMLRVYKLDGPFDHFYSNQSENSPWKDAALGQSVQGGWLELIGVRDARSSLSTLFTFTYDPTLTGPVYLDGYNERFQPYPHTVVVGDINGSGDDEIFMLRNVPTNVANVPRLFTRNLGGDAAIAFEEVLDNDNGYTAMGAGDTDSDGKDEVVVMRNNKIRVYINPDQNKSFNDYSTNTDSKNLAIGDLGISRQAIFGVQITDPNNAVSSIPSIATTLTGGQVSGKFTIGLNNIGTGAPILFSATFDQSTTPPWLTLTPSSNQTPATFEIVFNATTQLPGLYTTRILISTSDTTVINRDYEIGLSLTVDAAISVPDLSTRTFTYDPCETTTPFNVTTAQVVIDGTNGLEYRATILNTPLTNIAQQTRQDLDAQQVIPQQFNWSSAVPWASATSSRNTLPDTITISVDPTKRVNNAETANLVLVALPDSTIPTNPIQYQREVSLMLLCVQDRSFLPIISR